MNKQLNAFHPNGMLTRPRRGFTVIEFLLAISLFVIIAVSLYSVYANAVGLSRQSQNLEKFYRGVRFVFEAMTQDFENMVPYTLLSAGKESGTFSGGADEVALILPTSEGLKEIKYFLQTPQEGRIHRVIVGDRTERNISLTVGSMESADTMFLVRRERRLPSVNDLDPPAEQSEVLSRSVKNNSLRFSYGYLPAEPPGADMEWRDSWEEVFAPAGIRVEMSFVDPEDSQRLVTLEKNILIPTGFWGRIGQ